MRKITKKTVVVAAAGGVLMSGAGAAYAYWTAGGAGTGSVATGTVVALTTTQTSSISGMAPGDFAQTLSGKFTNTNAGPVYVTSVTASIAGVVKATGAPAGTCDASDYTLAAATMAVGHEVAAGTNVDAWSGATVKFNNKATNQDGCKGATVNLAYAIS